LANQNESEQDCEADDESNVELDYCFVDPEYPEPQAVCAAPNVHGLIRPTWSSKKKTEKGLVTVNTTETRRIKGNRKK